MNISSELILGFATRTAYSASKAAVSSFARTWALELGKYNICCNAIAPGFIETDMTAALNDAQREAIMEQIPLKRLGQVNDIAQAAVYLCGPHAGYMTGQVMTVDGGMVM